MAWSSCASAARTSFATAWSSASSRPTTSTRASSRPGCGPRTRRAVVLDVEILDAPPGAPPEAEIERLVSIALASADIEDGHVAIAFVDAETIASLNAEHRGKSGPTDVLSFPVDEAGPIEGPPASRELGDV